MSISGNSAVPYHGMKRRLERRHSITPRFHWTLQMEMPQSTKIPVPPPRAIRRFAAHPVLAVYVPARYAMLGDRVRKYMRRT